MTDDPATPPYRGQIQRVEGRSTKSGKRTGLPKVHEIELEHIGGQLIAARGHQPPSGDGAQSATGVCVIEPGRFPYCPICLREDAPADTMEHVPPKAFGGTVMAKTCADCNNRLGSRTEAALQDWYDDAIRAHFTSDASPKPFGHDRILLLKTESGEVVMLMEKSSPEGASPYDRLKDPNVEIHYTIPRPAEYMTGLLKSAYLAACLHFGGVVHSDSVMAARDELLRARDAKSRRHVQLGPVAEGLRAHRTGLAASGPSLALLRSDHEGTSTYLISLAGTILVEWPFHDVDPMLRPRMRAAQTSRRRGSRGSRWNFRHCRCSRSSPHGSSASRASGHKLRAQQPNSSCCSLLSSPAPSEESCDDGAYVGSVHGAVVTGAYRRGGTPHSPNRRGCC